MKKKFIIKTIFMVVLASVLMDGSAWAGVSKEKKYSQGQICNLVQGYIEKNMPWPRDAVRFEFISRGDGVVINGERISHRVTEIHNNGFIGDAQYSVKYYDHNVFLLEVPVRVRIEVQQDIVVASRTLIRDSLIGAEDVHVVKKWVNRISPNVAAGVSDVIGKRIIVTTAANKEIQPFYLRQPIMIKRGAPVRMVYVNGPLSISAIGYAEEDGIAGGIMRVRNKAAKKTLLGRVVGDSMVAIEF